jgi:hypothetical protein
MKLAGGLQDSLLLFWRRFRRETVVAWLTLLGAGAIFHLALLFSTSAPLEFTVFVIVLWAVAWLPVEDLMPSLAYRHGARRVFLVSLVWVAILVRGMVVQSYADPIIPLFPIISVILLAILLGGFPLLPRFREALYILSLMPVLAWLPRLVPTERLSYSAASFAAFFLRSFGVDIVQTGAKLTVGSSAINVAGPCSGNEIMAPVLGWVVNGLRVALLAILASFDPMSSVNDSGIFGFFHLGEGGMVFSGLGIAVYAYVYVKVIDSQLSSIQSNTAEN